MSVKMERPIHRPETILSTPAQPLCRGAVLQTLSIETNMIYRTTRTTGIGRKISFGFPSVKRWLNAFRGPLENYAGTFYHLNLIE